MRCVFRYIRTVKPVASGQQTGSTRTPCQLSWLTLSATAPIGVKGVFGVGASWSP